MPWDDVTRFVTECSILGTVAIFLVFLLRRETTEKTYWRAKALEYLGLGEATVEVAAELAGADE